MRVMFKQHRIHLVVLGVILWAAFGMNLGGRSFVGHVWRILNTPESRELGSELVNKVADAATVARRGVLMALGNERELDRERAEEE